MDLIKKKVPNDRALSSLLKRAVSLCEGVDHLSGGSAHWCTSEPWCVRSAAIRPRELELTVQKRTAWTRSLGDLLPLSFIETFSFHPSYRCYLETSVSGNRGADEPPDLVWGRLWRPGGGRLPLSLLTSALTEDCTEQKVRIADFAPKTLKTWALLSACLLVCGLLGSPTSFLLVLVFFFILSGVS